MKIKKIFFLVVFMSIALQADVKNIANKAMMNSIISKAVLENKAIVIDFFAEWCGPCKMMAPAFERLSNSLKDTCVFIKIDVDKLRGIAEEYAVMVMPTIVVLKNDKRVGRFTGSKTYAAMKKEIETLIK